MIIPKGSNPNYAHFQDQAEDLIANLNPAYAWKVVAVRHRKQRSNPQNRYHFGVVCRMICDETGNEVDDVHEFLLGEYAGWETYDVLGTLKKRPSRRSHDMDVETFESFNEYCRAWAGQNLGILIPAPGETIL